MAWSETDGAWWYRIVLDGARGDGWMVVVRGREGLVVRGGAGDTGQFLVEQGVIRGGAELGDAEEGR